MNRRQQNKAQACLRANEFAQTLLADFTHQPPTPGDEKFASARIRLDAAITALGGKQSIQAGGSYAEETEKQRQFRIELEDELADVNATAQAIADETANPAILERFRLSGSNGLTRLIAKARASPPLSASFLSTTNLPPTVTPKTPLPTLTNSPRLSNPAKETKAQPSVSEREPPQASRKPYATAPPPSRRSMPSSTACIRKTPLSLPRGMPPATFNAAPADQKSARMLRRSESLLENHSSHLVEHF